MPDFKIYSIEVDDFVPLTQQRLDMLEWIEQAYGTIRSAYQNGDDLKEAIEKAHARLAAELQLKVT